MAEIKVVVKREFREECRRIAELKGSSITEMLKINNLSVGSFSDYRAIAPEYSSHYIFTESAYERLCQAFFVRPERFLIEKLSPEASKQFTFARGRLTYKACIMKKRSDKDFEDRPEETKKGMQPKAAMPEGGVAQIFENLYETGREILVELRKLRRSIEEMDKNVTIITDNAKLNGKAVDDVINGIEQLADIWKK